MLRHYLAPSAHHLRAIRGFHFATLFLAFTLCLAVGCQKKTESSGTQSDQTNQQAKQSNQSTASSASVLDKGDLKLRYQSRRNVRAGVTTAHKVGSNQQALEQVINNLNNRIALPWDITISLEDCDGPNAYYEHETHQVTICHQLIDEYYELFSHKIKDQAKLDDAVRGAVASTFFHELGHALVDAWQLPITGKEEDAVDQLSTIELIERSEQGEEMALAGALSFKLYADLGKGQEKIYWDEHSLDEQRFFDTICLIYGHDPDKYDYLVKDGTLPEERAQLCREDYPRVERSWHQLLSPYAKQPTQPR